MALKMDRQEKKKEDFKNIQTEFFQLALSYFRNGLRGID